MIYISRTNVHDTIPLRFVGKIIILMDNEIITEDRKNLVFFYTFVFSNLLMTVSYKHIKLKLRDDRGRKISPSFPNWLSLRRDHNIYRIYSIYLLISYPIPKILIQWMFRWRERTLFNDDCSVMMFCTEAFAWTYHCYYCLYIYIVFTIIYNYYRGIGRTAPHFALPTMFITASVVVFIGVVATMGIVLSSNESRTLRWSVDLTRVFTP